MGFHWSLSDSKSSQVPRTLLTILAVLHNNLVWMVSTSPPTSKSSSPFSNPLGIEPKASITFDIIDTLIFHRLFNFLARPRYLSFFALSFSFILWSAGRSKSPILQVHFLLLLINIRSGLLVVIMWPVCMLKTHWSLRVSFSSTDAGLWIYNLFV